MPPYALTVIFNICVVSICCAVLHI